MKKIYAKGESLASRYGVRSTASIVGKNVPRTIYYSTSALKGGASKYAGNVVTRDAKSGKIIAVRKVEKSDA